MTAYELVSLYLSFHNAAAVSFMNFVTILFSVVVAIYVLGDRLTKPIAVLIVALFTLFTGFILLVHTDATVNMVSVMTQIQERAAQDGSDLAWIYKDSPLIPVRFVPALTAIAIIISYGATLAFLLHLRSQIPASKEDILESEREALIAKPAQSVLPQK